jgi:hypothetical protein
VSHPRASVEIDAPIDEIWDVMLDTAAYPAWNPFVVRAECPTPPHVGDRIMLWMRGADGKGTRSAARVSAVDHPTPDRGGVLHADLAYVHQGLPSRLGLVRATRHQRLTQRPGGPTTYDSVQVLSGPLVRLAGPGRVAEGFRRHAEALKRRCES